MKSIYSPRPFGAPPSQVRGARVGSINYNFLFCWGNPVGEKHKIPVLQSAERGFGALNSRDTVLA